ncbi:hypothetical protein PR048_014462, partial [Dryococelus australis]
MRVKRGDLRAVLECKGGENPEKTRRPAASSGTIPTSENPGATTPGIEFGSHWWEASSYNELIGELRFNMFGCECRHVGDVCSCSSLNKRMSHLCMLTPPPTCWRSRYFFGQHLRHHFRGQVRTSMYFRRIRKHLEPETRKNVPSRRRPSLYSVVRNARGGRGRMQPRASAACGHCASRPETAGAIGRRGRGVGRTSPRAGCPMWVEPLADAGRRVGQYARATAPQAEKYTACIGVDPKQGFQKCSVHREQSIGMMQRRKARVGESGRSPFHLRVGHCQLRTDHILAKRTYLLSASGHKSGPHVGVLVRLLASHQGEPGSIPGWVASRFSPGCHWSVGFLKDFPFPPPLHSDAAPYSPRSTLTIVEKCTTLTVVSRAPPRNISQAAPPQTSEGFVAAGHVLYLAPAALVPRSPLPGERRPTPANSSEDGLQLKHAPFHFLLKHAQLRALPSSIRCRPDFRQLRICVDMSVGSISYKILVNEYLRGSRWYDGQTTRLPPRRTWFDSRLVRSRTFAHRNRTWRCRWSGISRSPRPCISAPLHIRLTSPSSVLKTSMLRAAQISPLYFIPPSKG